MAFSWRRKKKPATNVTDVNNFANDPALPQAIKDKLGNGAGGSTSDVAAYKMLQNVTPEMLQDPEFAKQLNRFVGGNMASMLSQKMSGKSEELKKTAFRGNEMAISNMTLLQNMYMPEEVRDGLGDAVGQNVGDDHAMSLGFQGINEYMNTEMGGNMADLLGQAAQGMNDQGYSDLERSRMMMNHLVLRTVAPHFFRKGAAAEGGSEERTLNLDLSKRFQTIVNQPEQFADEQFINTFSTQLDQSGETKQQVGYQMPSRGMTARSAQSAQPQEKKKKWWQFWKS